MTKGLEPIANHEDIDMLRYDPFSTSAMQDPYPIYRELRDRSPIHRLDEYDAWAVARFDDVWSAAMNDRDLTTTRGTTSPYLLTKAMQPIASMNHLDPPEHRELRKTLAPFFLPARMREIEAKVRDFVSECMESLAANSVIDVVEDLAQVVAARVACLVSGFPDDEASFLQETVKRAAVRDDNSDGITPDGVQAFLDLEHRLAEVGLRRGRRAGAAETPLDVFVQASSEGTSIDATSLGQHLVTLANGGTDTVSKGFGSAVLHLWQHPDQRRRVAEDPDLVLPAVREALRFDTPTHFMLRSVKRGFEMGGYKLSPGEIVILLFASGNRDEREFEEPDRFDIDRRRGRFLSFGAGSHRCIGAHVAELQLRLMLEALLRRKPDYEVDLEGAERARSEFIQGFTRLPVHV